jgi:hypothetical protein
MRVAEKIRFQVASDDIYQRVCIQSCSRVIKICRVSEVSIDKYYMESNIPLSCGYSNSLKCCT